MDPDSILLNVASGHTAEDSRRLKKKRKMESTVSANAAIKVQPKKRAKGKGKAGKLEGLMLLPMDVLFEIFGHLRPLDILHLARTTKQFRSVLMHKSAISVWKAARANVPGFPDCFPGMNEAQFANLAFDQHCHVCLAPNIRSVDWVLRVRLCPKCTKTSYVDVASVSLLYEHEECDDECEYLAPARDTTRSRRVAFVHELNSIKEHWRTLTDDKARTAYRRERNAYNAVIEQHASTCYLWFKTQQLDRVQELEQARQDRKKAVIEKLEDLGWGSEIQKMPKDVDLGGHRLVKQPTRLTERIWKNIQPEMVKYMEEMKTNRLDRERKALIVARKFPAINILCEYKKSLLPWTESIMPEPVDFCNFAPVKAVLELPSDVEVDESSFIGIFLLLPSLFADWRVDIEKQMLKGFGRMVKNSQRATRDLAFLGPFRAFIREDTESVDEDSSDEDTELAENIALATTVFKCHDCSFSNWATYWDSSDDEDDEAIGPFAFSQGSAAREPLFYPHVMGHACLTRKIDFSCDRSDPSIFLDQVDRTRMSWSCKKLEVSKRAKTMMEAIVDRCGLEPLVATANEMDNQDTLLGCPLCANWTDSTSNDAKIPVFGWRAALKHHAQRHFHQESIPWIKLSEDQAESARQTEEAVQGQLNSRLSCTHCLDRPSEQKPMALAIMIQHLLSKHDIPQPRLNIDYYAVNADTCGHGFFKSNVIVAVEKPEPEHDDYFSFYSDEGDDDFLYY
ncbi:hypothetical protein PILCRDRAFT_813893 [Piloderma croceum F 1598]|uniref:F-box domain-containing protein n=1 Tax=Piloderma croceum (strain F 1598) TaxID=765440 RepID=A0A0C3BQW7_PILCF|nr:hypothetical protein PILCRDRAFT_813893 [Piloderma croceum F 1598]